MPRWEVFIFETYSVFLKRFQKAFFFFFKITLKINNKFLKSRHISGNSVVKNLNLPFGNLSYDCKERIDFRKVYFFYRNLQHVITVSHHLAHIHFPPQCKGVFVQKMNSVYDFLKTFRIMETFFYHPFSFLRFSIWAK